MKKASDWSYFIPKLSDQAAAQGKHLMIEEWGVPTDSSYDSVAEQAAVFNGAGVPWVCSFSFPSLFCSFMLPSFLS
jgi:hypothetical protein